MLASSAGGVFEAGSSADWGFRVGDDASAGKLDATVAAAAGQFVLAS
jgi:hypothetical protein